MNHTAKAQLLVLMDENPGDLTDQQLVTYLWLVEQLLQEVRQRQVQRQEAAAQQHPVRPSR